MAWESERLLQGKAKIFISTTKKIFTFVYSENMEKSKILLNQEEERTTYVLSEVVKEQTNIQI